MTTGRRRALLRYLDGLRVFEHDVRRASELQQSNDRSRSMTKKSAFFYATIYDLCGCVCVKMYEQHGREDTI